MSALVLTPSTFDTTLYIGPRLGKIPAVGSLCSPSADTVSSHGSGFSSATLFSSPDSITQADSPVLFSLLRVGSGQLAARGPFL